MYINRSFDIALIWMKMKTIPIYATRNDSNSTQDFEFYNWKCQIKRVHSSRDL